MRIALSLVVLLTITPHLFSQIDSTKIAFVSYWSLGDSYDFKVSKIKKLWKGDELTKDQQQSYKANFKVVDSTADSYTIKWSYERNLGNTYNIPKELLNRFTKYNLTEILYKTSEVGVFLEIINWQEVGATLNHLLDEVITVLGEGDEKKQDAITTSMQPFRQIYSSKQGIEQLVLKELQLFHFPMGLEYDITTPLLYDDEIPNMLVKKPIKAKTKLYFENVDFENGFCVAKQEMNLDPDDTKEMLKQVFKQMNLGNKETKKALKTAVFKIDDRNVYEYYYNPGIPHNIESTRTTTYSLNGEAGKRIDQTIIELLYQEDCSSVKTGRFMTENENTNGSLLIRTETTQEEIIESMGVHVKYDLFWTSDCSYVLTNAELLKGEHPAFAGEKTDSLFVDIISVTDDYYTFRATSNISDHVSEGKINRLTDTDNNQSK